MKPRFRSAKRERESEQRGRSTGLTRPPRTGWNLHLAWLDGVERRADDRRTYRRALVQAHRALASDQWPDEAIALVEEVDRICADLPFPVDFWT